MIKRNTGFFVKSVTQGETVQAFVPKTLPPDPTLNLEPLYPLMDEANQALGQLEGISMRLPNIYLFLYMYIRKEALLSSQIEGTQSSLSELLLHESSESPGVPLSEIEEVLNYVTAMNLGLQRLEEIPLSLRLIKEIHHNLLSMGRGKHKQPGEFRTSQNWIGGTRPGNALFVPPPPNEVLNCMGDLELFIHNRDINLPILIKVALVHVQFETIHPFLDGNGRIGRLLITLMLCAEKKLQNPLLYLSLYFKTNRQTYYKLLNEVREEGTWENWIEFFLIGVRDTSNQAIKTSLKILDLFEEDVKKINTLGRAAHSVHKLHKCMENYPVTTIHHLVAKTDMPYPTVNRSMRHLIRLDIVRETTGHSRNRVFEYQKYLSVLSQGTDPL